MRKRYTEFDGITQYASRQPRHSRLIASRRSPSFFELYFSLVIASRMNIHRKMSAVAPSGHVVMKTSFA